MSDGKIDPMENICSQSLAANGDKEDEALNNSVSDGEIVDDDDPEEQKSTIINFSHRKVSKNFRSRHKNESDDEADGNLKPLTFSRCSLACVRDEIFDCCVTIYRRQEERHHRHRLEEVEGAHR